MSKPAGPMLAHITGNAAEAHFAVVAYDAENDYLDLLVNTLSVYSGIRPVDFDTTQVTARLEVSATGPWQIELFPLATARQLVVPGSLSGTGDEVIRLAGGSPDLATISGNAASQHFAVIGYDGGTDYCDLMVNTIDPYAGTVIVEPCSVYLEVKATGEWDIQITAH